MTYVRFQQIVGSYASFEGTTLAYVYREARIGSLETDPLGMDSCWILE